MLHITLFVKILFEPVEEHYSTVYIEKCGNNGYFGMPQQETHRCIRGVAPNRGSAVVLVCCYWDTSGTELFVQF